MLTKVVSSVGLLALLVNGQAMCEEGYTPAVQDGTHNYVIDLFTGAVSFPYAIGKCTSTSVADTKYYMYTCDKNNDNKWEVTKLEYTTSTCTGSAELSDSWVEGDAAVGEVGYFVCDAYDTHVKVQVGVVDGCLGAKTVYAGLKACVNYNPYQIKTYCASTEAEMQFYGYTNATSCPAMLYCMRWKFTSTCTQVGVMGGVTPVYGKFEECMSANTEATTTASATTTTMKPSSASAQIAVLNIILALIVSLYWFF
jgi:hypothetical protein